MALWIAGLGTLGPKGQKLSGPSLVGLLLGFVGVALLVWPDEMRITPHVGWQLLVLAAAFVWASGTIVYRNTTLQFGPIAFNAMIMLVGGVMLGVAGIATGELAEWHWQWRGMLAIVFLAVFASAITYTAFTWLMKNARTDRVATFAYVNPAIATVLGWVVLGETLTPQQMLGMLVVLGGVVLVTMPEPLFLAAGTQSRDGNFSNLPDEPMRPDAAHDTMLTMIAVPTQSRSPRSKSRK